MNLFNPPKYIRFDYDQVEGENAYTILAAFKKVALLYGWTKDEVNVVREKAFSGDYDNLQNVFRDHCK